MLNDAGDLFAWQHDPEAHGRGIYTFFDNESVGAANTGTGATNELAYSRAITVRLNVSTKVVTLLKSDNQPAGR